ncbi:PQQ-dependent sugar dehydrogenase [Inquilinus sp. Marseille-Q2685]|uniref:PQQ-dependent sugar dehydrogenase n=1 Tax=Inquilinus sp. Marseille-Q2685 TaxID=2866581 RepID=UPI001CE49672|nr:PQQ-dependent sugar dehydrogenase [Inquilinus sp. Marseille-Q2685]
MRVPIPAFAAPALTAAALLAPIPEAAAVDAAYDTEKGRIRVQTVVEGLSHPWGLAFLPDGRMLVTERDGNLRLIGGGKVSEPLAGVPEVDAGGQGGLLDVAVDPAFIQSRMVYLSYSEAGDGGNSTAVARGRLSEDGTRLTGVEVIFSQKPKLDSAMHFGSRLVFDRQGHLFITLGERSKAQFRDQAQQLGSHLGKVIRIWPDGSAPEDNPFTNRRDALPEIWSYGHRNIQGAALNPDTGVLWINEHGPRGGDEINIPEAGKNYGWPVVSHGVNYNGSPVGTGRREAPGMTGPIYHWTPSIGVSGMAFYTADAMPGWRGDVFVGGLAIPKLVRLERDGDRITGAEDLLEDLALRIRQVVQGPDGALYLLTDESDGEILRVGPAS